jgi:hypothetical protein
MAIENVTLKYSYFSTQTIGGYAPDPTGSVSVNVVFTYNTATDTVTGVVRGTRTIDGTVEQITGIAPAGTDLSDNMLFIGTGASVVDADGITLITNDSKAQATFSGTPPINTDVNLSNAGGYDIEDYDGPAAITNAVASVTCFAAGTALRTVAGDVAVEDLRIGDLVLTNAGVHRPVRWLGHRTIDCRHHPRPHEVLPVRIAAHAFGPGEPARDLLVSPGHAICVDLLGEVLIPAGALVNGATIQPAELDQVTYWHVELDGHDILLAENLPAESYLEMSNRSFFEENGVVSLDALPDAAMAAGTDADFCRPLHREGPLVDVARSQLRLRAIGAGWTLDASDPFAGLHLLIDGVRAEPVCRGLSARFNLPAGARDVWLISATSRPCEIGLNTDDRTLGVRLSRLAVDDGFGAPREISLADPRLCVGFHAPEDGARRWTAGRARLPATLWAHCPEGCFLLVELGGPALPRWIAPAGEQAPPAQMRRPARPELVRLSA